MSIFNRMADIFKSNVNEALDRMEDPEKMVKQMIIEMEEGLVKATSGLAKAMANEKNLQKQQAVAANQARQWEEKATMALKGGNTDLAKQARPKKGGYDGQVQQYQQKVTQESICRRWHDVRRGTRPEVGATYRRLAGCSTGPFRLGAKTTHLPSGEYRGL